MSENMKLKQTCWNTGCSTSSKIRVVSKIAVFFWRLHCRTDWEDAHIDQIV